MPFLLFDFPAFVKEICGHNAPWAKSRWWTGDVNDRPVRQMRILQGIIVVMSLA
eukprot:COSAG02_NODE_1126_length_14431_cov_37.854452_20_plen_54_part_00